MKKIQCEFIPPPLQNKKQSKKKRKKKESKKIKKAQNKQSMNRNRLPT